MLAHGFLQALADGGVVQLLHFLATGADEEIAAFAARFGVVAADKGVEPLQFMYQPVFQQEVQRAIYRGWLGRGHLLLQLRQHIIGLDGLVALPYQLQHPFADGGEVGVLRVANGLCVVQGVLFAVVMVLALAHGCLLV